MAESCGEVRFTELSVIAIFQTNVSQASVAMRLRYGGIFNYRFSGNVLLSPSVKKMEVV